MFCCCSQEVFPIPSVGDLVDVEDGDDASGWLTVKVVKVRTATFDVKYGDNPPQKITVRSKCWRPQRPLAGSRLVKRTGEIVARDLLVEAAAKVEEVDSQATKARAAAFAQKRAELDSKVNPMADDADSRLVANVKASRQYAQALHPSSDEATEVKKAIAEVEAKRDELAEAEAKLRALLAGSDKRSSSKKKQKVA